jgi:hypothetical protein
VLSLLVDVEVFDLLEGESRGSGADAQHGHGRCHEPIATEGEGDVLVHERAERPSLGSPPPYPITTF